MALPEVRSAIESERAAVLNIIALAFATDPLLRWAILDGHKYLSAMGETADAFGGVGLAHDATFVTQGMEGAALWLPPGTEPDSERLSALMQAAVDGARLQDFLGVFEQMGNFHPHEPHWYLPLIGVDPAHQGQGHGAALMRHAVQGADADGVIAYLESSNPRNISLYQRHGFDVLGTIQVGNSPVVTPMLRAAR